MRTVHETEALRPSDPIPKSMHGGPGGKQSKLKIIIKKPQGLGNGQEDAADEPVNGDDPNAEYYTALSKELFDKEELAYPVDKLYRKCHFECKWAKDIGDELEKECKQWEDVYYREWLEKEALLTQVIKSEVDWHERRQAVLSGVADVHISGGGAKGDEETKEAPNGHEEQEQKPAAVEDKAENGLLSAS